MPGRHRNPDLEPAIIAASKTVVATVGYQGFSIERVAQQLGVPRSTIYARWPTKADLLDVVLSELLLMDSPRNPTLRAALVELLKQDLALFSGPEGRAAAQLLLAAQDPHGPSAEGVRARLLHRRSQYLACFPLEEVDENLSAQAVEFALSTVWGRSVLLAQIPMPDAERLADIILSIADVDPA